MTQQQPDGSPAAEAGKVQPEQHPAAIEGQPVTEQTAKELEETPAVVKDEEEDPEPYSFGDAWDAAKESWGRLRKAVLYPAARAFKGYVDNSLDAVDGLADGFEGKKKRGK